MKKILKKFQRILAKNFFVHPDAVDFNQSFQKDLKLNESEFIAMIAYTENAFKVQIADNELSNIKRVRDVVKYINSNS